MPKALQNFEKSSNIIPKKMAKNEEKPCPEIFTSQKLKFSAKLVKENAILTIFLARIFFRFSRKIAANSSFFVKNENAKKCNNELDLALPKSNVIV